jgi:hypothetical protein
VREGQRGGYQFDTMAEELMAGIVERYLVQHRSLLQQDAECRGALIEILDTFVRGGSLRARRLSYHLGDIFR